LGYLGRLGQETGGNFRAELLHLTADDEDCVVGVQRTVTERNGKRLEVGNRIVFELTNGRVTEVREHFSDLYAWDEFWS
jgi:ketosteroid isomerase-like protein